MRARLPKGLTFELQCAGFTLNRAMQREAATVLRHLTLLTLTRRESGREDAAF